MNKSDCRAIFEILRAHNAHPTTELNYHNAFELLIAVILSAQATDVSVNKVTPGLFAVAPTAEKMAALGTEKIESYIKTIGLYRAKAKHIAECCQTLTEKFNGQVPDNREDLESLAGVGRKTANVVLNTAFGVPVIAVDTHIFRVANRTGLATGKTVREVEDKLMRNTPQEFLQNAHHWLILHGRYICKARQPLCNDCYIRNYCAENKKKGFQAA